MIDCGPHIEYVEWKNLQIGIEIRLVIQRLTDSEAPHDLRDLHRFAFLGHDVHHRVWLQLTLNQVVRIRLGFAPAVNLDEEDAEVVRELPVQQGEDQRPPDRICFSPRNRDQPLSGCDLMLFGQVLQRIFVDSFVTLMEN